MIVPRQRLDQVNQLPLNQHARKLLRQLKQQPRGDSLYLLQLLEASLDKGLVELNPKLDDLLRESLQLLQSRSPETAMRWLLQGPPDPDQEEDQSQLSPEELDSLLQENDPVEFATTFWQLLQNNLQQFLPQ